MKNELDRTSIHLQESLGENRTIHAKNRQLQDELDSISSRATQLEDELVRISGGITKAMQVLQEYEAHEGSMLHGGRQGKYCDSTGSMVLGTPAPIRDEVF